MNVTLTLSTDSPSDLAILAAVLHHVTARPAVVAEPAPALAAPADAAPAPVPAAVAPAPEKPKRTRKAAEPVTVVAAPAPVSAEQPPAAPAPVDAPVVAPEAPPATCPTIVELRALVTRVLDAIGSKTLIGVFKKFGASKLSDLAPEVYTEFAAALNTALHPVS